MVISFYANKLWWDSVDFASLPINLPDGYNGQNRETGNGYWFSVVDSEWLLLGQTGGFSPPDITELVMWYDLSDPASVEVTGSNITQLTDKSVSGTNLTQGVTNDQPEFLANQHNGLPIARFDGVSEFMQTATANFAQPNTIFIVSTFPPTGASFTFDGITAREHFSGTGATSWRITAGVSLQDATIAPAFSVRTVIFDGATSLWRTNGIQVTSGNTGTDALQDFVLANSGTTMTSWGQIDVGEIVIYNKLLSAQELLDVEQYLTDKWL